MKLEFSAAVEGSYGQIAAHKKYSLGSSKDYI